MIGKPNSELEGFVVFEPRYYATSNDIALSISKTGCRLSRYSLELLRDPDFVVTFFDDKTKRLMITPAKKGVPNSIKLSKQGAANGNTIIINSFINKLLDLSGIVLNDPAYRYKVSGHKVNVINPTLIFNLAEIEKLPNPFQGKVKENAQ